MAKKTRKELENIFQNGHLPSQRDFSDLIDSMLNRKDDNFFGQWKPGERYCPCDVVLYKKSFYVAKPASGDAPCEQTDGRFAADRDAKGFCSTTTPDQDTLRWGQLELEVRDEDWVVDKGEPSKCDDIMYAGIWGKIGMGTDTPKARVDITVSGKGSFLFDPEDNNAPEFVIRDHTCPPDDIEPEIRHSVTQQEAYWYINVPGYAFKKLPKPHAGIAEAPDCPIHPDLLMFITTDHLERPALGIGTDKPEAAVDAFVEAAGRILLRPGGSDRGLNDRNPEIVVVNLADGQETWCKITVEKEATVFRNPADKKIIFRQMSPGNNPHEDCKGTETTLLALTQVWDDNEAKEARVGIGTDTPNANLEITDKENGTILAGIGKGFPVLSLVNFQGKTKKNYASFGVNATQAIFVTDSESGFEFRKGKNCGENPALDINPGDTLMTISKDGRVSIGAIPLPSKYELDVKGEINSFGTYIETDANNLEQTEPLDGEEVLKKLRKIDPVRFKWKDNVWNGKGSDAWQIGLVAEEVGKQFEELVKNVGNGRQAVAYQNMVGVLVAAIKELDKEVKELRRELGGR